jgi:carboxypeptidase C (cathepsin A)
MTSNASQANDGPAAILSDNLSQTRHSVTVDGRLIHYIATAGTMVLRKEDPEAGEKPTAALFFVAYTLDRERGMTEDEHIAQRPITFSFNGGPGSSSVWLHLGLLGPRRVLMDPEGHPLPPPYKLVDNEYTLLDQTDLVFIDPVTTGFSRAVPGQPDKEFHGFEADISSVGDFIRLYTSRYRRWTSPKYLIGESYGTTRSAGLSGYLQERHGLYLNGIMLISSILNFQTAYFRPGNDLPYSLFLPTYTATAWYHNRLDESLQAKPLADVLTEAEAFALGDYTLALMRGDSLPDDERRRIAAELARLIGLSQTFVERANLRVEIHRFVKELLRDERRTVGRLDSRFTSYDRDAAGEYYDFDPSYAVIQGPYTATLNDYVRRELRFESDLPYEILTGRVHPWDYTSHQNQYVNVAETLRQAMTMNPYLRVFVANGYYDLATPYLATHYTFNHLGLEAPLRPNVSMAHYEAGHMMYVQQASLVQLKADLSAFISSSHGE